MCVDVIENPIELPVGNLSYLPRITDDLLCVENKITQPYAKN